MNDLIARLRTRLGAAHVLTGEDAAPWARDWTGDYAGAPLAVVRPADRDEVAAVLWLAADFQVPVVPVAGNTGLNGGAIAPGAIALSVARLNRIREIRPESRLAVVGAGVIVEALDQAAAEHGLCFPLFFGAAGSAMIGGVLSTNAGGSNVLRYGTTRALCLGLEAVLPDGRILDLMTGLNKDNTGFDLRDLMIGAEGQLGIITAAVMRLHPRPVERATAMVALDGLAQAPALLTALQDASGNEVAAFEYMPRAYIEHARALFPQMREPFEAPAPVNLLVEVQARRIGQAGAALEEVLGQWLEAGRIADAVIAQSEAQRREMWALREASAEIVFCRHPVIDTDIALPLDLVEAFLTRIEPLIQQVDPGCESLAVAHLGDGNIHFNVWLTREDAALAEALRETIDRLVVGMGGTFSAEHGIGIAKRQSMARFKDPVALDLMRSIKQLLDPAGLLNPGKTLP
ncbi:FAD-binding oxidoreductase [Pseudodonghicola flavimaris]|uniref:FAD-binding oxidoreductase n=1 Tax=Pseudodonghicola flavimaris TaxID=3050036 RepID=A0ABT7EX10_9RHOB|nr:FAD-binding oxidoreductase [Pseudodonghicola flavimaris]MDK3016879.1 FAD-binding oxidoreductase [Pseudodonghicola flavimaris]